ncbi:MAG: aminomethyl-transferring glycine dehydrogenase subunit GcvPB [Candidatus Bathyarchaeota archaeon]|nr:MAG: aminomethyl-transferring glycine dehydrogenase subunit GcvPB [Candidatus Bathyarchaeota archaeon]
MELTSPGERGILPPTVEEEIRESFGDATSLVPASARREIPPGLPELSQAQVLRHYLRLSQMTLGMELDIDIGVGTCTMKYSPKVNERLVAGIAEVHPLQDEGTMQGILEIAYKFGHVFLREISGMDAFSFQPPGGSAAAYNNAAIMRKYHEVNGELDQRNEIITTIFSHPCDAACPATAGFKLVTIHPDPETGLPDTEALKAAVSGNTAGLFITNPEDTGIFNPEIDEWTKIVHEVGGLCSYDQANANAIMGVTRAREAGFDMCFFNLHKTFSSPHGSSGPGCGGVGVVEKLEEFLPVPVVVHRDGKYFLDYDRPNSIGKIRDFMGNIQVVLRSYAWCMAMGARGLREAAEVSMINNQYLEKKLLGVRGVTKPYSTEKRVDQIRFSLEGMRDETGVGVGDFNRRVIDYGVQSFFTSHHPWIVPEPFTPEPCETYSKADIDHWVSVVRKVSDEAYSDPELVKTAPHNAAIHTIDPSPFNDPERCAMTWRAYLKKGDRR